MTRIISGFAGSIAISVPPSGTRPTSDRVREAMFSALEARDAIDGMRVLDLYAGSGALGLEAVSRGASHVTLVDRVIRTAQQNAARVLKQAPAGTRPELVSTGQSVQSFLDSARSFWDLVFLDPPYDLTTAELDRNLVALVPRLTPGAVVVVERSSRSAEPSWPEGLEFERRKDYGETAVYWASAD
ncbi:16S rRNA (guanine(966)-N(2))-methyltransferase RsmD [Antiquaquibacter soli]|uniref:16S rRNA (Guanine(966)-N(2))-methyltransferase RsmD n=1 Tax=Antiquaquibacter soli TaxID=3064523 RepID=A0ABT9BNG4_9MICO|nr:16S rRNA (guanine(966)-N(2))-methyltransferase RsmD [Protaetiibacter sp. WY-16]MDO7882558.1 16S rRNA (guanine(966)-N(2))-methyltransferase RsmD [Protaetiibacter sp. WY-16]